MTGSTVRLRRLLRPREDPNHPTLPVLSVYRDHGVVPKDSRTDNFNKTPEDLTRYLRVLPGDLVVNKMKAWSGSVAVSRYEGIVSGDYLVCAPLPSVDSQFLHHLLRSDAIVGQMRIRSKGIRPSQERLYWDDLGDIAAALPPVEEQRRIADFLDDQVVRIDNIIAARLQQVRACNQLLQSEVDAIFAAPDCVPVSRLAKVLPGYAFPSNGYTDDDGDIRLLRGINVAVGELRWNDTAYWPHERLDDAPGFRLAAGDVVIGMDRPWIGDGLRIARVTEADLPCLLLQRVAKLLPGPKVSGDYLYWAYHATTFREEIEAELSGLSVPHLSGDQILRHRVPALLSGEQTLIVERLERLGSSKVAAQADLRRSVDLLTELKSSLITAAVMGDFDVSSASTCPPLTVLRCRSPDSGLGRSLATRYAPYLR